MVDAADGHSMLALVDSKKCAWCRVVKHKDDFHKDRHGPLGRAYYCKVCANQKTRDFHSKTIDNPDYQRRKRSSWIKAAHGITLDQYEEKLAQQNYACAICGVKLAAQGPFTHLDHCHKSGVLRAFLCTNCNRGLGHFQDSVEFLQNAITYLNTHSRGETAEKVRDVRC